MEGLTPRQLDYFKTLEAMNPSENLRRSIEAAKDDLRHDQGGVVRGLSRVKGFTPNEDTTEKS